MPKCVTSIAIGRRVNIAAHGTAGEKLGEVISGEEPALAEKHAVNRVNMKGHVKQKTGHACFNCVGAGHLPKMLQCPALRKKCQKCYTMDHFVKICKAKAKSRRSQSIGRYCSNSSSDVSMAQLSSGDLKTVICLINNLNVTLTIDLGAKVSLISRSVYK